MNSLSIIISFVVGGLLLVTLIVLNGHVAENSSKTVQNMAAKKKVTNINKIMQLDFMRIGYHYNKKRITTSPPFDPFPIQQSPFTPGFLIIPTRRRKK